MNTQIIEIHSFNQLSSTPGRALSCVLGISRPGRSVGFGRRDLHTYQYVIRSNKFRTLIIGLFITPFTPQT